MVFPDIPIDPNYNPFSQKSGSHSDNRSWNDFPQHRQAPSGDWRLLYGERTGINKGVDEPTEPVSEKQSVNQYLQVNQSYILTTVKSGLLLIDQHLAHTRILFEKYLKELENHNGASQQELFPQAFTLNPNDASMLKELLPELENLGFVLEQANPTTFMINGTPSDSAGHEAVELLEKILDNYKINRTDLQLDRKLNLAKTLAAQIAIKPATKLTEIEMQNLVDQLFACNVAEIAPNGKKIYVIITMDELLTKFN